MMRLVLFLLAVLVMATTVYAQVPAAPEQTEYAGAYLRYQNALAACNNAYKELANITLAMAPLQRELDAAKHCKEVIEFASSMLSSLRSEADKKLEEWQTAQKKLDAVVASSRPAEAAAPVPAPLPEPPPLLPPTPTDAAKAAAPPAVTTLSAARERKALEEEVASLRQQSDAADKALADFIKQVRANSKDMGITVKDDATPDQVEELLGKARAEVDDVLAKASDPAYTRQNQELEETQAAYDAAFERLNEATLALASLRGLKLDCERNAILRQLANREPAPVNVTVAIPPELTAQMQQLATESRRTADAVEKIPPAIDRNTDQVKVVAAEVGKVATEVKKVGTAVGEARNVQVEVRDLIRDWNSSLKKVSQPKPEVVPAPPPEPKPTEPAPQPPATSQSATTPVTQQGCCCKDINGKTTCQPYYYTYPACGLRTRGR